MPAVARGVFMRSLVILALLANFLLYAFGTGAFGPPPEDAGRDTQRLQQQLRADAIALQR